MKRRSFVRLINSLEELNGFGAQGDSLHYNPIPLHVSHVKSMLSDEFARLPLDTLTRYFEWRDDHPRTPVPFKFGGVTPGAHLIYDASDLYDYCVGKLHKLEVVFDKDG